MIRGTIKFFNNGKFFGFIKPDDGGPDIYCAAAAARATVADQLPAAKLNSGVLR